MKVNHHTVIRTDDAGIRALARLLGYKPEWMDGEDWHDFYLDAESYVEEEACADLEATLMGHRYNNPDYSRNDPRR